MERLPSHPTYNVSARHLILNWPKGRSFTAPEFVRILRMLVEPPTTDDTLRSTVYRELAWATGEGLIERVGKCGQRTVVYQR